MESVKITSLDISNAMRVKAVTLVPTERGLTIIGGRNRQGKTSVLRAIEWLFGGERHRPSEPRRDGSVLPPKLSAELSNGIRVERSGNNSSLKVIDASGNRSGQTLLDEIIGALAFDLPRFMQASSKEKAETLLQILGIGDRLHELDQTENRLYNERTIIGREGEKKIAYANELPSYPDAPDEPVSVSDLIRQQQGILAKNGENQRLRNRAEELGRRHVTLSSELDRIKIELTNKQNELVELTTQMQAAQKSAAQLIDESTAEIETSLSNIDDINTKVRANHAKEQAQDEASEYGERYNLLTEQIEKTRKDRIALLEGAELPLPGLSVLNGELTYEGYQWDNMASSDQLKIATAIVRKLNPGCGFVLLDKLEQMDIDTLQDFGAWLEEENLQVIATRVSTGDECSVLIEDGEIADVDADESVTPEAPVDTKTIKTWKVGDF